MEDLQRKIHKLYAREKQQSNQPEPVDTMNHTPKQPATKVNKVATDSEVNVSSNKSDKFLTIIIKIIIWAITFLVPIFFLFNTPSSLELSKQTLLVTLVGIAFLLWVGKMAIKSQIKFRANFIFVPIFVLLVIFGLSTLFADYPAQSLWGFFGGEARSYVSIVFLAAFFILFVNHIKTKKDIVISLVVVLISGILATSLGVAQLFGKFILPMAETKTTLFNTIGTVYLFGAYVASLFLISIGLLFYVKSTVNKILFTVLSFLFFGVLLIVGIKTVWIALVIALILVAGWSIVGNDQKDPWGRIIVILFLTLALLAILRTRPIIPIVLPPEVLLGHKLSFKIAWQALKDNFLFGTGPANFINVYRLYRPLGLGNYWATNFNTASSYFLTISATVGILGLSAFLFLVISGLNFLFKGIKSLNREMSKLAVGLGGVWVFLTVLLFTYITNITILFMWWLVLALLIVILSFGDKTQLREFSTGEASDKPSLLFSFVFVLTIIGVVVALYLQEQKYVGAMHYKNALVADAKKEKIENVISELSKAISLDLNRDLYYRNRSLAFFALANKKIAESASAGNGLSAEDAAFVGSRIKDALRDAKRAEEINPNDVDNQMALANIYESLLSTMENADEEAVKYMKRATELDPHNPVIYQQLANVYIAMADMETLKARAKKETELPEDAKKYLILAKENINKALEIKGDFLPAQLALVAVYERLGETDKALEAMAQAREKFPTDPRLAYQYGLLLRREGRVDEALIQFAQAVSLDNNFANAHFYLGWILDEKGRKDLAIKEFEKVLQLNPGEKLVEKILENLRAGRSAMAGLQKKQPPQTQPETINSPENSQPNINPDVEKQEIPEEVTKEMEKDNAENTEGENKEEGESAQPTNGDNNSDSTNTN